MLCFAQNNVYGPGMDDVSALLRRVADTLDAKGELVVHDLVMHSEVTGNGYYPSLTVYYSRDKSDIEASRWKANPTDHSDNGDDI